MTKEPDKSSEEMLKVIYEEMPCKYSIKKMTRWCCLWWMEGSWIDRSKGLKLILKWNSKYHPIDAQSEECIRFVYDLVKEKADLSNKD
jgi:hypothetical protein